MENNKIFRFWVSCSMRDFHVTLMIIAVGSWIVGNLSKIEQLHMLSDVVALFAILHFFIHSYFHRQQKFLSDNQRVYSLPKKKIAKSGAVFLLAFLGLAGAGIAIVKEVYTGTLLVKAQALWMIILAKVFRALLETDGLGSDELTLKEAEEILGLGGQIAAQEEKPWEAIIDKIQTVLIVIGVIVLVVVVISLLTNYVRHIIENSKMQMKERTGLDVNDKEESLWGKTMKKDSILDFSPTAKTRRIYRKCINRMKRRGQVVPDNLTPAEIERLVNMPMEDKYMELHHIYEKARYSEMGCSEEEVKRAKELKV